MKMLGLLGGLGPEATVMYYQQIIRAFTPQYERVGYPAMIIHSVDLKRYVQMADNDEWSRIAKKIAGHFEMMRRAGAQVGAMTANTPHKVFDQIQERTQLPLISIVKATVDKALGTGLSSSLLLGTRPTMSSDFYPKAFQQAGIMLIVPDTDEQEYIHGKIFAEIEHGIIKEETRQKFLNIIKRYENQIDSVILGCTELPLILDESCVGLPCLNTTTIHIRAIVKGIDGDLE